MEILNVQVAAERRRALELFKNLFEKDSLIPILGAGFSAGNQTDNNGTIPSVWDLHKKLFSIISRFSGYDEDDLKYVEKENLSDLAGHFWDIYDRIPEEIKEDYFEYVHQNFLSISFRKGFQDAFLKIHWPYLFTLNYDSLIEDSDRKYYPIIPYDDINPHVLRNKIKLFKLHGDANKYWGTGDRKYFILSRDQYVSSLMSDENKDMRYELQTAFSSKGILFLGCGLSEELDLLYSSQISLQEKVKDIDPEHQAIIYISFEPEEASKKEISQIKKDQLARYGVTHILRIFKEKESEDFFEELSQQTEAITKPGVEDYLERYSSMRFENNNAGSCNYLFQENLVWENIDKHAITMPDYTIERSGVSEIVKMISENEPLCFIAGNFFSGKTFVMLEVAKYFSTKKVYVFPSGSNITDEQLSVLAKKENTLCCFDSKSLTVEQIKRISSEKWLDSIKCKKSSAIVVIDNSDAPMYKYIFESRNVARDFQQVYVPGVLDCEEGAAFNKNVGAISLPPYANKDTLLDYVVTNEKDLIGSSDIDSFFLDPLDQLLEVNINQRIKALIMLATEIRIPAKRAIEFNIDQAINELVKCCKSTNGMSVIERDYSVYNGESSGYEFVCNSKYWIIRVLSIYAKTKKDSINVITNAYCSIIENYRSRYADDVKFYQSCELYYFFDHIQNLFNEKWFSNSSKLMNEIYDKLLPVLANSYQFLHQKAKGKLIIGQVQIKNERYREGKKTLTDAALNITRAIKLAEQYPDAKNIAETILHMTYTKGRILIASSCVTLSRVPQAVDTCYTLYEMQKNIRHDAYDFTTGTGNDKVTFNKFKLILLRNKKILNFEDLDLDKMSFLLRKWTGKKFVIKRKQRNSSRNTRSNLC